MALNQEERSAAIILLEFYASRGVPRAEAIKLVAENFSISERTVRSWRAALDKGLDPSNDRRLERKKEDIPESLHPLLIARTAKSAWEEAVRLGLYTQSYPTFMRDIARTKVPLIQGLRQGNKAFKKTIPKGRNPHHARIGRWVVDSSQSNVRVRFRGGNFGRPWYTVVRTHSSSVFLALAFSQNRPSAGFVAATLAEAMADRQAINHDGRAVRLGGKPPSLHSDSGGENIAEGSSRMMRRLGTHHSTSTPEASYQNGSAENGIGQYQLQFEQELPALVKRQDLSRKPLFVTTRVADQDIDSCLTHDDLRRLAREWVNVTNSTPGADGLSPLDRMLLDGEEYEPVDDVVIRTQMLASASGQYLYHADGIHFDSDRFQGKGLTSHVGRSVTVKYFPGQRDWIEVYDGDRHLARCWRAGAEPAQDTTARLAERSQMAGQIRRAERQAVEQRLEQVHRHAEAAEELSRLTDHADDHDHADTGAFPPTDLDVFEPQRKRPPRKGSLRSDKAARDAADDRGAATASVLSGSFAHLAMPLPEGHEPLKPNQPEDPNGD